MKRPTVIYLACPMRSGHWTTNVRNAAKVGKDLMRKGYSVINPAGSWLLDLVEETDFDDWIQCDFGLVQVCDCVLRIPGFSVGGDMEADFAVRHDIPLFTDMSDLYATMPNEMEGDENEEAEL